MLSPWEYDSESMPQIQIEPCIALYYPLPRFFVSHKSNQQNALRIYQGLLSAYQNGRFQHLWEQYFMNNIKMLKLQDRRIIPLKNPFIEHLDPSYQRLNATIEQVEGVATVKRESE